MSDYQDRARSQERAVRLEIILPLVFHVDGRNVDGHTVNVSASGLLATFYEPVDLWTSGEISMGAGEYLITIQARVARTTGSDTGLSFLIDDDNDRLSIQILLDYAAGQNPAIPRVP